MAFLHRHLPISGRIVASQLERIEELPIPVPALRETLVNAFCHRDYSTAGGSVSVAIFDDRIEIWSEGTLPFGLQPDELKRVHASRPRNPTITNVVYRRGLIEQWGRGTNRVVEMTLASGAVEPEFVTQAGSTVVSFRLPELLGGAPQVTAQVTTQVMRFLSLLQGEHLRTELMEMLALKHREHFRKDYLRPALDEGLIEMTMPDKPNSRFQKYRLSEKGARGRPPIVRASRRHRAAQVSRGISLSPSVVSIFQ